MTTVSRLFIAIFPDEATRGTLARLSVEMAKKYGGRAITPENIHITLRFLGNTADKDAQCIRQALAEIRAEPMSLVLDQLECRPRQGMVWIGSGMLPPAMPGLIAEIEKAITGCGLPANNRAFLPHITLVRKAGRKRLSTGPRTMPCGPVEMDIRRVELVKSQTLPEGSRYTSLHSWPLDAGQ